MPSAQQREAMEASAERRRYRSSLRREVKALPKPESWERLATLIEAPDRLVESMAVADILVWGRGMGPGWLERVLSMADVPSYKRLKLLDDDERGRLSKTLRECASMPERHLPSDVTKETERAITRKQQRASLKRSLSLGDISLVDVIRRQPECCWEMPTYELIQALPGIGPARLQALNVEALAHGVNLFTPFFELTPRARGWLAQKFS